MHIIRARGSIVIQSYSAVHEPGRNLNPGISLTHDNHYGVLPYLFGYQLSNCENLKAKLGVYAITALFYRKCMLPHEYPWAIQMGEINQMVNTVKARRPAGC